jgi:hypothetical protein
MSYDDGYADGWSAACEVDRLRRRVEVLETRLRSIEASLAAVAAVTALEFGGDE